MDQPAATVLITTKDRADELPRAIDSVARQTAPVQLVVVDDGSSDHTSELVRERYPWAELARNESALGIIEARNKAASLAKTNILFTLDDDAEFSTPDVVADTLALFDHPRVAAVTIPLVNHIEGREERFDEFPEAARTGELWCSFAFKGGANAMRLDVFREMDGYRGFMFRQGEESDYCIRLLDRGYVVRAGTADPVDHYPSPRRDSPQVYRYTGRNNLLFAWYNVPMPHLLKHWAGGVVNLLRAGVRRRRPVSVAVGIAWGLWTSLTRPGVRKPVSTRAYQLSRTLIAGARPLSQIENRLPEPTGQESPAG